MRKTGVSTAKRLRRVATNAEARLWYRLRNRQICGAKFRRQEPRGQYITDFVCLEHRLIIEIDGGQHAAPDVMSHDIVRTGYLEGDGFRVLRFWNNEILENIEGVLAQIRIALTSPPPSPRPSPQGEREPQGKAFQHPPPSPQRGEGWDEGDGAG